MMQCLLTYHLLQYRYYKGNVLPYSVQNILIIVCSIGYKRID